MNFSFPDQISFAMLAMARPQQAVTDIFVQISAESIENYQRKIYSNTAFN
jgi:hypothetical protein